MACWKKREVRGKRDEMGSRLPILFDVYLSEIS